MNILQDIYLLLEKPAHHKYGKVISILIFSLIVISTVSLYLSSVKEYAIYNDIFNYIENITMLFFTLELLLRIISIGQNPNYSGLSGKLKYLKEPFTIIDLLVLIPYYLTFFGMDLVFLRALRTFRILKLLRYEEYGFDMTLLHIIKENKEKFAIVLQLSTLLIFTSAPIMYYLEHDAQPEIFRNMLDSLWWTVVTFTTVGYGDMYPITGLGRIFGTFLSVMGIPFYAVPGAIVTTALLEKLKIKDSDRK